MTRLASAPARVNLLGEHVDHQGGTVLPVAIHLRTSVRYEPADAWSFVSEDHADGGDWVRYPQGVIAALEAEGHAPAPGRLEIRSTVPEGKGLASSAALEVAVAGAVSDVPPLEMARLCRRAEHEAAGVPCGLMDQAAAACAIQGHVLVFDCSDDTFFHLPLPEEMDLLLVDPRMERRLKDTPYAERQEEAKTPGTPAARHVAEERARVERGIEALDQGDVAAFGALLYESHASLRDLYRCSAPVLDQWVEYLAATPGVLGARLVGGGWGGCILAVAEPGTRPEGAIHLVSDDGLYRME